MQVHLPAIPNRKAQAAARALGWFSILLGVVEVVAPGKIKGQTGAAGSTGLLGFFGSREIASGIAILSADRPVSMVWGRVTGDVIDLMAFLPTLRGQNPNRAAGAGALAFIALATVVDLYVALQGDDD